MFALMINASILILAAATFYKTGNTDVAELAEAHSLLPPLLGSAIAPTLFGIALLCCGLNSTVTATMAGQIVMEGFLDIRLPAWLRRLVTRSVAIVPAAGVTLFYGERRHGEAADPDAGHPQPAAAVRDRAAGHVHREPQQDGRARRAALADRARGLIAAIIIALNLKLLFDFFTASIFPPDAAIMPPDLRATRRMRVRLVWRRAWPRVGLAVVLIFAADARPTRPSPISA